MIRSTIKIAFVIVLMLFGTSGVGLRSDLPTALKTTVSITDKAVAADHGRPTTAGPSRLSSTLSPAIAAAIDLPAGFDGPSSLLHIPRPPENQLTQQLHVHSGCSPPDGLR